MTAHDWVNGWCRGCGQHDTTMNLTGECSLGLEAARQLAAQPNAQSRPPVTPAQPRHPLALLADGWEARARLLNENARAEQSEQSARYYAARAAEAQDCAAQLREALRAEAEAEAGQVLVNRQALTMILSCLQEGADDPHWEQVYPTGYLFSAVNELTLNLEGQSDPIERQVLVEIAEEARAALAQAGGEG